MKRLWMMTLILPAMLLVSGCGYNQIQTLDETVDTAKGQIQAQLQRRIDLVPNLVETVKGYAAHETEVFTNVAEARARLAGAVGSGDAEQMAAANDGMSSALGRLLAISEAYPLLKADQNFLRLQDELTGTENRIAVARTDYNAAVQSYNTYIRKFPQVVTAKVIGAEVKEYFKGSEAAQTAPTVKF